MKAELKRLEEDRQCKKDWKRWGGYLAERAWGTVREDYSRDGSAWQYLPFDAARSKTFRWNEDGLAGICDKKQRVCFALSFWNEKDDFLKERIFGLSGTEGNHGEDVKDYYFYLDNTPTHSYMKFLYKYPQEKFPYQWLRDENIKRDKKESEFELINTGIFDEDKYFDIFVEYAKADTDDICIKITAFNRSKESAPLHILPTIWFRNTWSWYVDAEKPHLEKIDLHTKNLSAISLAEKEAGNFWLYAEGSPALLFTENETNYARLYNGQNASPFVKDGINDFVVDKKLDAVNPQQNGTKAAAHYFFNIAGNSSETIYLRLTDNNFQRGDAEAQREEEEEEKNKPQTNADKRGLENPKINNFDFNSASRRLGGENFFLTRDAFIKDCENVFEQRKTEADEFYADIIPPNLTKDAKNVMRQSLAGLLWSKQYYRYIIKQWLEGDPKFSPPPRERLTGRNYEWKHLYNADVISMPDKWEYPWYAAWDLAFHCIALATVDSEFAKAQLVLLLREWYMHPSGQVPAYEWKFEDVNPPVHAWAALRVYQMEKKRSGAGDRDFLEKVFHKLLLNFTWWVNRKDEEGNNVFEGGFLGLDNIGVFDRSKPVPYGGHVEQSDGTSWMAMFCLNMLGIALELAETDKVYEDVASKFFEHFVYISDAMNNIGEENTELWNQRDGFYYDVLHLPDERNIPIRVRSMVGLIPLFAVETVENEWLKNLPEFKGRMEWFLENRPDLTEDIECVQKPGKEKRRLLALVNRDRLQRILRVMLSEAEFLSDYGIRSLSRTHKTNPYVFEARGETFRVDYEPAESSTGLFGGNSNWRGPIWFPVNYLLIEALQKFDHYFGDDFKVEFPTGSEKMLTLWEVSQELSARLAKIFLKDAGGRRAVFGNIEKFQTDDNWRDLILFHEYFHGDNGEGLGASHQTGWTGLIAKLLQQLGDYAE